MLVMTLFAKMPVNAKRSSTYGFAARWCISGAAESVGSAASL
jgi:hypothetical protein